MSSFHPGWPIISRCQTLVDLIRQYADHDSEAAFAELSTHEMGGVTRCRVLKKVMLSADQAQLQIQFGGLSVPIQTIAMEKLEMNGNARETEN